MICPARPARGRKSVFCISFNTAVRLPRRHSVGFFSQADWNEPSLFYNHNQRRALLELCSLDTDQRAQPDKLCLQFMLYGFLGSLCIFSCVAYLAAARANTFRTAKGSDSCQHCRYLYLLPCGRARLSAQYVGRSFISFAKGNALAAEP